MRSFVPTLVFHRDHLSQQGDPWLPSRIGTRDIREIRPGRRPPEVVLEDGSILFVSALQERALVTFGRLHGLPFVERSPVWSLLCEPFLDTEHDPGWMARVDARLAEDGFGAEEVARIRQQVGPDLLALNSFLWEWVDLGHTDVLTAHGLRWVQPAALARHLGAVVTGDREDPPWRSGPFRRWTEDISHRAREMSRYLDPPEEPREQALQRARWRKEMARSALLPQEILAPLDRELDRVLEAWASPHRHYHGPGHLLAVLDGVRGLEPARAWGLAAFFHDAVLEPGAPDNEVRSADWLERALEPAVRAGAVPATDVDLARRLVLATARPLERPRDEASRRFIDVDFGVFGTCAREYDAYVDGVRREYGFLDPAAFGAGRRRFLEGLREAVEGRGFFFESAEPLQEELARENLERELAGALA